MKPKIKYDPDRHHRHSIRLKDYDYSQGGAYFVTICTHERRCLFGEIHEGEMRLNDIGVLAFNEWLKSAEIRREIQLDAFVVMPNHVHGIVFILQEIPAYVGATGSRPRVPGMRERRSVAKGMGDRQSPLQVRGPRKSSLASFIGAFKSTCTRSINEFRRRRPGIPLWQRNFYEHVIRNEKALSALRDYIAANPAQWTDDPDNPDCRPEKMLWLR